MLVAGNTCISVIVDGKQRFVQCGQNKCSVCFAVIHIAEGAAVDAVEEHFVDGRIACDVCRQLLNSSFMSSGFHVCVNVLCRRKWKQLTPRVVPFFCPSCRKNLEGRLKSDVSDIAYLQAIVSYWSKVMRTVSAHLDVAWSPTGGNAVSSLQDTLERFELTFSSLTVAADKCRNWNSMLVRKKYYRGIVSQKDAETSICRLRPEIEQTCDLRDTARPLGEKDEFFLLDWKDEYQVGQSINFLVFPNPVVSAENDFVGHIVKVVTQDMQRQSKPKTNQTECVNGRKLEKMVSVLVSKATPSAPLLDEVGSSGITAPTPRTLYMRTPSFWTPPTSSKVNPLWNVEYPSDKLHQADFKSSPPPPGLERSGNSTGDAITGFVDLMQWSDVPQTDCCDSRDARTAVKHWYDPLETPTQKMTRRFGGTIGSVPEHSALSEECLTPHAHGEDG